MNSALRLGYASQSQYEILYIQRIFSGLDETSHFRTETYLVDQSAVTLFKNDSLIVKFDTLPLQVFKIKKTHVLVLV